MADLLLALDAGSSSVKLGLFRLSVRLRRTGAAAIRRRRQPDRRRPSRRPFADRTVPQPEAAMSLRATLDFLLYDWIDAESLTTRARFADHSRQTFDAVLDTCERIAREKYAPHNRTVDIEEPRFDGEKVILPRATHEAHAAFAGSGMLAAAQDFAIGGMQLPYTLQASANSFFAMASASIGWGLLTTGNANLLMAHGTERQKTVFARNEFSGRWSGTMCLSEPQAGSSLGDVAMRAVPDGVGYDRDPLGPRYRLTGSKMWISGGDHELTENIVHLVLAKIPDAEGRPIPGTRGISLFIVPKRLVDADGRLTGTRNDVAVAGLNHKLGWRGTPNTLLNFGEGRFPVADNAGAVGYRVGAPGDGLRCMFHMMNEARIGIGTAATMLGLAGYYASLEYAKNRPQGRPAGAAGKDPSRPQVPIIEHADVKRMLLAQKSYCEGALALELHCARLVDEQKTGASASADDARLLLEILTPIAKSYPSEWCLEANSLAIQIHGGYGYTRDFPVEQYWRDNRLNMIHEGTHGIQAADLLGRKVRLEGGRGLALLGARIDATIERARPLAALADQGRSLAEAFERLATATRSAWATQDPVEALANAVPYLQAFGHVVVAWIWLDVAERALALDADAAVPATIGRIAASDYFFRYELPKIVAWLDVVERRDQTCAALPAAAF
jgi:butyryl-CoA dehydrogenase